MPYATFSNIDFANGFDFWKTIPTRRRRSTTSVPGRVDVVPVDHDATRRACVPGITSFRRFSVRRKVLFPHPDGPMSAVTRFAGISQ